MEKLHHIALPVNDIDEAVLGIGRTSTSNRSTPMKAGRC